MPEVRVRVCAHLAREAVQALEPARHGGARVKAFPPLCDPRPPPAPLEVEPGDVVVGGPCAHRAAPGASPRAVVACETCFHLFTDRARVDALLARGAFLVTPGWLARWRAWLDVSGFDRDGARQLFAESATAVVLLDTGVDPEAPAALEAFAAHVGLPAERVEVGLERFALVLGEAVQRRRADRAEERLADHAMALDALASLPPGASEDAVFRALARLAQGLCGARRVAFWPVRGGDARPAWLVEPQGAAAAESPEAEARVARATGDGLVVRVGPPGAESGWLSIAGLRFPEHLARYRQVAECLAQAGHLAFQASRHLAALEASRDELRRHRDELESEVARRTATLEQTVLELRAASERIRVLRGLIPICFACKKIRDDAGFWQRLEEYLAAHSEATFSHGLCPECLDRLYPPG